VERIGRHDGPFLDLQVIHIPAVLLIGGVGSKAEPEAEVGVARIGGKVDPLLAPARLHPRIGLQNRPVLAVVRRNLQLYKVFPLLQEVFVPKGQDWVRGAVEVEEG